MKDNSASDPTDRIATLEIDGLHLWTVFEIGLIICRTMKTIFVTEMEVLRCIQRN